MRKSLCISSCHDHSVRSKPRNLLNLLDRILGSEVDEVLCPDPVNEFFPARTGIDAITRDVGISGLPYELAVLQAFSPPQNGGI